MSASCGSVQLYAVLFFLKEETAYEMHNRDWIADVCSSDLVFKSMAVPRKSLHQLLSLKTLRCLRHRLLLRNQLLFWILKSSTRSWRKSLNPSQKIGRESCRERVCRYV